MPAFWVLREKDRKRGLERLFCLPPLPNPLPEGEGVYKTTILAKVQPLTWQ
jgi:hypothetical protein